MTGVGCFPGLRLEVKGLVGGFRVAKFRVGVGASGVGAVGVAECAVVGPVNGLGVLLAARGVSMASVRTGEEDLDTIGVSAVINVTEGLAESAASGVSARIVLGIATTTESDVVDASVAGAGVVGVAAGGEPDDRMFAAVCKANSVMREGASSIVGVSAGGSAAGFGSGG